MRPLNKEEQAWLDRFNYNYDRKRTGENAYRRDTMARMRTWVSDGRPIDNIEDFFTSLVPIKEIDENSKVCLTPSKRGLGRYGPAYSMRDYWVLPSLWHRSGDWSDALIQIIDEGGSYAKNDE
jgi:hypothetical protein